MLFSLGTSAYFSCSVYICLAFIQRYLNSSPSLRITCESTAIISGTHLTWYIYPKKRGCVIFLMYCFGLDNTPIFEVTRLHKCLMVCQWKSMHGNKKRNFSLAEEQKVEFKYVYKKTCICGNSVSWLVEFPFFD